ncbi:MAG: hypothetical protein Q9184_000076 [Pyrenodesmia sp. 2 TL-2023]
MIIPRQDRMPNYGPLVSYPQRDQRPGFNPHPEDLSVYGSRGSLESAPGYATPTVAERPPMAFYGSGSTTGCSLPLNLGVTPYPAQFPPPRTPMSMSQDPFAPGCAIRSPDVEETSLGRSGGVPTPATDNRLPRRSSHRDEFDGPHQFLRPPPTAIVAAQERELPHVPTNLLVQEQDDVLSRVNDRLSQCAFDFIAKYQFPVPLEQDKRPIQVPSDREWSEWVNLLKRLATKRRIPARVLYQGQIKQFITILENSLEMRHAAKHQSRPLKDDRNILQLISAGLQVAKILKDAACMEFMDTVYRQTERVIQARKATPGFIG